MASNVVFPNCSVLEGVFDILKIHGLDLLFAGVFFFNINKSCTHLPILTQHSLSSVIDCSLTHKAGITGEWTRGKIHWDRGPSSPCLSAASPVVVSFLEIELPLTSKRIFLKVPGNRRAASVVPQWQTISPRCIHWRSNWVKCPPSKLAWKNCPTQGLSCIRPRTKGKPQSLA